MMEGVTKTSQTERFKDKEFLKGLSKHCVFCLQTFCNNNGNKRKRRVVIGGNNRDDLKREVGGSDGVYTKELGGVREASGNEDAGFVTAFNLVWPWVQTRRKLEEIEGDDQQWWWGRLFNTDEAVGGHLAEGRFGQVPAICVNCADLVWEVNRAMRELQEKVMLVRKTIRDSQSERKLQLQKCLEEQGVNQNGIDATVHFLDSIGGTCTEGDAVEELHVKSEPLVTDEVTLLETPLEFVDTKLDQSDYDSHDNQDQDDFSSSSSEKSVHLPKRHCQRRLVKMDSLNQHHSEIIPETLLGATNPSSIEPHDLPTNGKDLDLLLFSAWNTNFSKLRCPVTNCTFSSPSKKPLRDHIITTHCANPSGEYPCPRCGKEYTTFKLRAMHMTRSTNCSNSSSVNWRSQKCDLCKKIVDFKNIEAHVKGHVGEEYALKCINSGCRYWLTNTKALQRHYSKFSACKVVYMEKQQGILTCNECSFEHGNIQAFRGHLTVEHERGGLNADKPLGCPINGCDKRFWIKQSVDLHIADHMDYFKPAPNQQKCEDCGKLIEVDKMEEHLVNVHGCLEVIKCLQCPFQFSSREKMVPHLYCHRKTGISCDICGDGVKYSRFSDARDHYIKGHGVNLPTFTCQHCAKQLFSAESLKTHIGWKHGQLKDKGKGTILSCDLCGDGATVYKTPAFLLRHKIVVHGEKPFTCNECGQEFHMKFKLSKHLKEHAGQKFDKQDWICEVEGCGKIFGEKKGLSLHRKHMHQERKHVCEECGKAYAFERDLKEHVEVTHLGVRKWVCDQCGEGFTSGTTLKRHKRIHTGEKPFECEVCGQRFRHKVVMQTHLRGHREKGEAFRPTGPMKGIRKRKRID